MIGILTHNCGLLVPLNWSTINLINIPSHTCQVTRFRRVTPGNRAFHPHFPEHQSGHGFHYDDLELVQILEIFIYSENTGILPIERTTI